jgi:hypothetical protein
LWSLGIFFPVLVICTKKNLATLVPRNENWRKNSTRGNKSLKAGKIRDVQR